MRITTDRYIDRIEAAVVKITGREDTWSSRIDGSHDYSTPWPQLLFILHPGFAHYLKDLYRCFYEWQVSVIVKLDAEESGGFYTITDEIEVTRNKV